MVEGGEVERGERSALLEELGEVGFVSGGRRALVPPDELDGGELRPGGEEEEAESVRVTRVDRE